MANILLPQQVFNVVNLQSKFPPHGFKSRKIFLQCELREVTAKGDLVFGVIAYAAWRRSNSFRIPWEIAKEAVRGDDVPGGPVVSYPVNNGDPDPSKRFVSFGNNEIPWPVSRSSKSKLLQEEGISEIVSEDFFLELSKILDDKSLLEKSTLKCKAGISKNPHVYYDVQLDSGTTDTANPCPPNQPGDN